MACAGLLPVRAEIAPPALPAALAAPLRAAGSGLYTWWGFEVYQAGLWVEPGFEPGRWSSQKLALELQYRRAFAGRDIATRSLSEMRRVGTFSDAQGERWRAAMAQAFPDVAAGDRLTGLYLPGRGAQFFHNGRPTQEIADAEFARLFFGIWLSEQTSAPGLRSALLGATR